MIGIPILKTWREMEFFSVFLLIGMFYTAVGVASTPVGVASTPVGAA